MKNILRIALPALEAVSATAPLSYAWFDRQGHCARSGELAPAALATAFTARRVEAVLHPADAIVASVQLPAVNARLMTVAVQSALEPLVLSDVDTLAVGHGPRAPDGSVTVAWAPRDALTRAWQALAQAGLRIDAILPTQVVLPPEDAAPQSPLQLPADARWRHDAPSWSLALPELGSQHVSPWRGPLRWAALAAVVWIGGLNIHAAQLRAEAVGLRAQMERQVREAFPTIPVVVDALRQAEQGRNALLAAGGGSAAGDFMPLALATASIFPFAAEHVLNLHYTDGTITLKLDGSDPDADKLAQAPAMVQKAAALGVRIEKQDAAQTWRVTRSQP